MLALAAGCPLCAPRRRPLSNAGMSSLPDWRAALGHVSMAYFARLTPFFQNAGLFQSFINHALNQRAHTRCGC
jgi:hypothetical protein